MYAHHIAVLDAIENFMQKLHQAYIRIDGSVSNTLRHERVKQFQNDSAVKIAILGITAAGIGITLTAASIVVFVEMHFTPAIMV